MVHWIKWLPWGLSAHKLSFSSPRVNSMSVSVEAICSLICLMYEYNVVWSEHWRPSNVPAHIRHEKDYLSTCVIDGSIKLSFSYLLHKFALTTQCDNWEGISVVTTHIIKLFKFMCTCGSQNSNICVTAIKYNFKNCHL